MTKTREQETVRVGCVSEADRRELEEYFRWERGQADPMAALREWSLRAMIEEEPW